MSKVIVRYGIIAGLIVGISMILYMISIPADAKSAPSMLLTYVVMLVALSMVFVGIKQYRDKALGGVIRFMPALLVGLGISAVAGVFYALAWEVSMAFMKFDFIQFYADSMVEQARASGADAQGVAAAAQRAADFTQMYDNPLIRVPFSFLEIFPVGILVSLISAAILRNSRVLPARAPTH
jgi:Protein of unknown function (DUF4199)